MNVKKKLEQLGCIHRGHFVGVSGNHISGYCNIDPLVPHVSIVKEITKILVKPFARSGVQTVVVPAVGAIPLSQWGPYHLESLTKKPVLGVWADKVSGQDRQFAFERSGFMEAVKGKKVLIIEDTIYRMTSVKKIIDLVNSTGGKIVGVASIGAYQGVTAQAMKVPRFESAFTLTFEGWTPEECKKVGLCAKKIPIVVDVGHGKEFQEENPDYPGGFVKILKNR